MVAVLESFRVVVPTEIRAENGWRCKRRKAEKTGWQGLSSEESGSGFIRVESIFAMSMHIVSRNDMVRVDNVVS